MAKKQKPAYFPLNQIISGGQTGADIAGLIAAKRAGIETGGWIPNGFRTLAGNRPEYGEQYQLKEHSSDKYPPRTWANVAEADATIRFALHWNSKGELLTLKAIEKLKKPAFAVDIALPIEPAKCADWLSQNQIHILNVAGNSELSAPGIESFVIDYLTEVFRLLAQMNQASSSKNAPKSLSSKKNSGVATKKRKPAKIEDELNSEQNGGI